MQKIFDFSDKAIQTLARTDTARALEEDLGSVNSKMGHDLTAGLISPSQRATAQVLAREGAVICGVAWVEATAWHLDPAINLIWHVRDGQRCTSNQVIGHLEGRAQALLTAERTALNFLQLLSAVATKTADYVDIVRGTKACIVDTRKTMPGLRLAQKYAVRMGGGTNHRIGLYDAVLIKENHIAAAGGIAQVLVQAHKLAASASFIEIEVETLAQLELALSAGARMILLDNMDVPTLKAAVALNQGRAVLEVSGGVTMQGLRALAETGVDRISIGALTKDVRAVDFSMRFESSHA